MPSVLHYHTINSPPTHWSALHCTELHVNIVMYTSIFTKLATAVLQSFLNSDTKQAKFPSWGNLPIKVTVPRTGKRLIICPVFQKKNYNTLHGHLTLQLDFSFVSGHLVLGDIWKSLKTLVVIVKLANHSPWTWLFAKNGLFP